MTRRKRRISAPHGIAGPVAGLAMCTILSLPIYLLSSLPLAAQAPPNNFPNRVSGQAQPYPGAPPQFPYGMRNPRSTGPAQSQVNVPPPANAVPGPPPLANAQSSAPATVTDANNLPPSVLQLPAHRAIVRVEAGGLYIKADNSNLSQILHEIQSATGTNVSGLAGEERIFGTYGPGNAEDVLNALLYGSDYNVLMVGSLAAGTPRELVLTRRTNASNNSSPAPTPVRSDDDADAGTPYEDQDAAQPLPAGFPRGEGRNAMPSNPLPAESNSIPPGSPDDAVRTPQQLLDQLQQLHRQNDGTVPPPSQ